jgi:hypothetical protein
VHGLNVSWNGFLSQIFEPVVGLTFIQERLCSIQDQDNIQRFPKIFRVQFCALWKGVWNLNCLIG